MDGKTLARIGAIVFVAFAIVATAIDLSRPDDRQDEFTMPGPAVIGHDPLDADLARCSALGEAGPRDPSCMKVWAENRRRFLGEPAAVVPTPSTSQQPGIVTPSSVDPSASAPASAVNGGR